MVEDPDDTEPPPYPPGWSQAGRMLVMVGDATDAAREWQVGDRMAIPVPPDGRMLFPAIEHLDDGPGHVRSAVGRIELPDGGMGRVVVTVGPGGLYAHVRTREGPYELVAEGRLGWMAPSSSVAAAIDFSQPDFWLPEHGRKGQ